MDSSLSLAKPPRVFTNKAKHQESQQQSQHAHTLSDFSQHAHPFSSMRHSDRGVDIASQKVRISNRANAMQAEDSSTMEHSEFWETETSLQTSHQNANQDDTKRCVVSLDLSLSASLIPPPLSLCPACPWAPPPSKASPPPPRGRRAQRYEPGFVHAAARGRGQAGTPFLGAMRAPPSTPTPPSVPHLHRGSYSSCGTEGALVPVCIDKKG